MSILEDERIRDAIGRAAWQVWKEFPCTDAEPHGLDVDDLISHAYENVLKSERKSRLPKDLRTYGYPAKGEPHSLAGVVYTAVLKWSRGYIGEESYNRLRERDETYAWTWAAARDAVIEYELTSDAPSWRSIPESVQRLADQTPNLTDAEIGVIERAVSGASAKNAGRAFGELVKLEARQRAKDSRRHDGVRLRPRMTPEIEEIPDAYEIECPYADEETPELYGLSPADLQSNYTLVA